MEVTARVQASGAVNGSLLSRTCSSNVNQFLPSSSLVARTCFFLTSRQSRDRPAHITSCQRPRLSSCHQMTTHSSRACQCLLKRRTSHQPGSQGTLDRTLIPIPSPTARSTSRGLTWSTKPDRAALTRPKPASSFWIATPSTQGCTRGPNHHHLKGLND